MTTDFMICNRKKPRWSMARFEDASIEFDVGATRCRFTLLDVSIDGISFFVPENAPEVQVSYATDAVVHVSQGKIRGVLRIVHVTAHDEGTVCGATLGPTSDLDARDWQLLIEDLEAADRFGPATRPIR